MAANTFHCYGLIRTSASLLHAVSMRWPDGIRRRKGKTESSILHLPSTMLGLLCSKAARWLRSNMARPHNCDTPDDYQSRHNSLAPPQSSRLYRNTQLPQRQPDHHRANIYLCLPNWSEHSEDPNFRIACFQPWPTQWRTDHLKSGSLPSIFILP